MTTTCTRLALLLTLATTFPALAGQVTLSASKDNTLYEVVRPRGVSAPPSNGAGVSFFAGRNNNPGVSIRRGVIAFDVAAAVPAGATIDSAELVLAMTQTTSGAQDVALHRLTSDWGEGTSNATSGGGGGGAPATTGDATWLHTSYPGSLWGTPGGDFAATMSATQSVGGDGSYTWGSTAQMVADVQDWLDNPGNNFGWILIGNEAAQQSSKRFASRENATDPPQLIIAFTDNGGPGPNAGIPTLSGWGTALLLGALALAGILVLRRKA